MKPKAKLQSGLSRVGPSVVLVAGLTLASSLTGFVRELITARSFGADARTDAFFAAFALVTFLFFPFSGGAVQGALMPAYQLRSEAGRDRQASALLGWASLWVLVASGLLATLAYMFADEIVRVCYGGFSPDTARQTADSLRVLSPLVVFAALGSVAQSLLHAKRRFVAPAVIPILTNGIVIAVVIAGGTMFGGVADLLSWGYALGYAPWILFLFPLAIPHMSGPRVASAEDRRKVLGAFAFLGSLIVFDQLSGLAQRSILSGYESGLISAFNYGTKLAGLPVGILAGSLTIVLFPRLVTELAGLKDGMSPVTITTGFLVVLTVMIPAAVFLAMEAESVLALIYGRDSFSPEALRNTTSVLIVYAAALPAQGLILFFGRLLVAGGKNRDLLMISITTGALQLLMTFQLPRFLGWQGVPVATLVYAYVHAIMLGLWAHRMVDFEARSLASRVLSIVGAAAVALLIWLAPLGGGSLDLLLRGLMFGAAYLATLLLVLRDRALISLFGAPAHSGR